MLTGWLLIFFSGDVQAVGGCRDYGAPASHVHRFRLYTNLQHRARSLAAVSVRNLSQIQQHPFPQL